MSLGTYNVKIIIYIDNNTGFQTFENFDIYDNRTLDELKAYYKQYAYDKYAGGLFEYGKFSKSNIDIEVTHI